MENFTSHARISVCMCLSVSLSVCLPVSLSVSVYLPGFPMPSHLLPIARSLARSPSLPLLLSFLHLSLLSFSLSPYLYPYPRSRSLAISLAHAHPAYVPISSRKFTALILELADSEIVCG